MTEEDALIIIGKYAERHGSAPAPMIGFGVEDMAEVMAEYMADGIPDDYDWYADVPEGADV